MGCAWADYLKLFEESWNVQNMNFRKRIELFKLGFSTQKVFSMIYGDGGDGDGWGNNGDGGEGAGDGTRGR